MKGGTRSNKRIFPHSIHSLLPTYAKKIRDALEKMKPNERMDAYIETVKHYPPDESRLTNIKIYYEVFRDEYPDEFAEAEKAVAEAKTPEKEAAEAKAAEAKAAAFKRAAKAAAANAEKAAATELARETRETLVAYDNPEKVLNFKNYAITEFDRPSISDLLVHGLKGGKTRRNRRGRGRGRRGRGRRSLKHYSKRR